MKTLLVKNHEDAVTVLETRSGNFAGLIVEPGFHLVAPWKKVAQTLTTHDFDGQEGIGATTREQKNICVSVSMNFNIQDFAKYHQASKDPYKAAVKEICAATREIVEGISFATIWNDRSYIEKQVHAKAAPVLREKFGMAFHDITVQQISYGSMCMSAPDERLNKVMADVAAVPDNVAKEMDKGLATRIPVMKPLSFRRP